MVNAPQTSSSPWTSSEPLIFSLPKILTLSLFQRKEYNVSRSSLWYQKRVRPREMGFVGDRKEREAGRIWGRSGRIKEKGKKKKERELKGRKETHMQTAWPRILTLPMLLTLPPQLSVPSTSRFP